MNDEDKQPGMSAEQVASLREVNIPKIFNMEPSEEVEKSKPVKRVKSGAPGQFTKDLIEVFTAAGTPLSISQVVTRLKDKGKSVANKQVADRVWLLAKKGILQKTEQKGVYQLA